MFRRNMSHPPSGLKNKPSRNLHENRRQTETSRCFNPRFSLGLFLDSEDLGDMFLQNVGCLNGLHGIISQKTELLITNAVKTSNPKTINVFKTIPLPR
jgi:hypothetical protein